MTDSMLEHFDKDLIEKIAKEQGFKDPRLLEKFIRILEVVEHVQRELSDCAVKGGMAVPFNLQDGQPHRLSVDVDMVTGMPRDQVNMIMEKIFKNLTFLTDYKGPHSPKNSNKKLPLLTYYCKYVSVFGDDAEMKIEIFHGMSMNIMTQKIKNPSNVAGIKINFPAIVYDSGSLIGDKMTTLAFKTVGIPAGRKSSVPKQIYDIACLLRSVSKKPPIIRIIETFEKTIDDERSYFASNPPEIKAILDDLAEFSDELFIKDQYRLETQYIGKLQTFETNMLGGQKYTKKMHITDIFLVKAIAKIIVKKINGAEAKTITTMANELLAGLEKISNMDLAEQNIEFKNILRKYGKASKVGKVMKNLTAEQAYLYDQIIEMEKP